MRYWLLLVLALVPVVLADATIHLPELPDFDQDSSIRFYFHVTNQTYDQIDSASEDCYYRFFLNNGTLVASGTATYNNYWYFDVPSPQKHSKYEAVVWCNGTDNGFASAYYDVKPEGESIGFLWLIVLLPLIFVGLLLFATYGLSEEHHMLKVVAYFFTFIGLWISYHHSAIILSNYYGFDALQNAIGDVTYYVGVTFFVIMSYFIVYAIYSMVQTAMQDKKERMQY